MKFNNELKKKIELKHVEKIIENIVTFGIVLFSFGQLNFLKINIFIYK